MDAPLLPLDTPLQCRCETSGLAVEISVPDLLLLHCPRCGEIFAGQPVGGEPDPTGVRPLTLNATERDELLQALAITPDLPLASTLERVLTCTQPLSLRLAQQRLSQRGSLLRELSQALHAPEAQTRSLALQLVSRMPQPPIEIRPGALHAIQMLLREDARSEALRVALCALHPLASLGRGATLRGEVERIARETADARDDTEGLVHRIASAVLAAIDRATTTARERFDAHRDKLLQHLRAGDEQSAHSVLERAYPTDDPEDPDGGMSGRIALCRAAITALDRAPGLDAAAGRALRQTLLGWALAAAEVYASWSTSGGEGLSRMVEVNALRRELRAASRPRSP